MPSQPAMDAFTVWIRRNLHEQFGKIEAVPEEMLALIDVACTPE